MDLMTRLKELRRENNLNQDDVAHKLNISTSAYGYYEQGKTVPNATSLSVLADMYDVSTDYLLGRTDVRSKANFDDIKTIAAHHDDENNFTEEELESIEEFKAFVKSKRKK